MQKQTAAHRVHTLRRQGALALLRHAHAHPAATRADAARALGLSSGSATEITARLKALRLLDETVPPQTGGRGRPSPALTAHPRGPLVCAVSIGHERWRTATVELGGRAVDGDAGRNPPGGAPAVLGVLRARIAAARRRHGHRIRAVSVAVAGTLRGTTIVQASGLNWHDIALEPLRAAPGTPLLAGNDASMAGLAEARRGAAAGARVSLHLTVEVGVGGILIVDGRPVEGATGAGGEFGHMPFGDPGLSCPCGARGCWDLAVDGRAMARALGRPEPRDPRTEAERILAAARSDPAARAAVGEAARALGRGAGALVNALDPELVTLSGLATGLVATAPDELDEGYTAALMRFRRAGPPPLVPSALGPASPLTGAAEAAFDAVLSDGGFQSWSDETES
ncbi:ROK family protein [Actinomadura rugatobispora]|uniref:ROK family protein n=1 Tax=Actinomadura rugatobispora TaxID=1994 RepID=A0ABW1A2T1_9ACTN|nr:ROK family transcriptional regulator [Actinomadura rugatobispora]